MKPTCDWIEKNLEAYFCDRLSPEDAGLLVEHVEACRGCRDEVQALRAIDSVVKADFQRRMAVAQSGHTPVAQSSRTQSLAFAGVVAVLLIAVVLFQPDSKPPAAQMSSQPEMRAVPQTAPPEIAKANESDAGSRAKLSPAVSSTNPAAGSSVSPDRVLPDAPEFAIIDPAGYFIELPDYRGHVLLFGVWSSARPETYGNLQKLYDTFGANTKLRLIGISNEPNSKPPSTTFPVFYNRGSRLLDARPGDWVLLDDSGRERNRGSLLTGSGELVRSLRAALEPLGIR